MASRLNPQDATFSLHNVILPKVTYPLATMTFSQEQCNRIMRPLLQTGLAKGGVVCTFPRAVVHGPLKYGGLDLPNLHTEQTLMHVKTLLQYGSDHEHLTGFLLHATVEALCLELGYCGEMFSAPADFSNNLTDLWLTHLWHTAHECHFLILSDFDSPMPVRLHDIKLMQLFYKSGQ